MEGNHLMIVWKYSVAIKIFSAKGQETDYIGDRELDFLSTLDKYATLGYDVINIIGDETTIKAFLKKRMN
jgi:hypothetical protein